MLEFKNDGTFLTKQEHLEFENSRIPFYKRNWHDTLVIDKNIWRSYAAILTTK
ncbi:MAG: hypothetical protein K9G65_00865 [Rickettsiaceae bacterium]|nr:hypothetical protein [Rickettsiaceae bacterium]